MPDLSPQAEIAVLARTLYREGYDDHDNGHITFRQADGTFLAVPDERGWDEVTASDIIRIDLDGNVLEGRWGVTPAIILHMEFHRAKPGVDVTVHQHPRYATIWSTMGRIPPAYDQRAASVGEEDIALYDDYAGSVDGRSAALAAVEGIGDAKCALLRNHGVFVIGDSIRQAYSRAVNFEWRCKQAWHVEALGEGGTVPAHGQEAITRWVKRANDIMPNMWEWAVRREVRLDPDVLS